MPLASLGILSAAPYEHRRDAARQTYLRTEQARALIIRFVVLTDAHGFDGGASSSSDARRLAAEHARHGDMVAVPTNGSRERVIAPLVATFGWLRIATAHEPYNRSSFVLKADDDAYIVFRELVSQLRHIRSWQTRFEGLKSSHVYFGRFYWTSWHKRNYMHNGTGYIAASVWGNARVCLESRDCSGPYPFATGSLQGLSFALAHTLANAPAAVANVDGTQRLDLTDRKVPAYEDAWMGFALTSLLPPSDERQIAVVFLSSLYFRDDYGFVMHNYSMLVHPRAGKEKPIAHLSRFRAATLYSHDYHCPSRPKIGCSLTHAWSKGYPATVASSQSSQASCRGCVPGKRWKMCTLEPANRSECPGFSKHNFGTTDSVIARFGPGGPWERGELINLSRPF